MMSFLMSQLIPGSLAFIMMSAHCFKPCMLQDDYAEFRSNFLRAFEASHTHDSFLWAFRYAESLTAQFGNVGHMVGKVHATEYAHDASEFLKSGNWIQNGQISLDKLQVFLEFTSYVNYLTPRERRVASIIEIKPIDSLFDFAMKISNKLQELPHTHSLSPIISDFSGHRLC